MNAPARLPATDARWGDAPSVLSDVAGPGVAAAIWRRTLDPRLAAWLDALPAARAPALRATVPAAEAGDAVLAACARAGAPEGHERALLADDVAALAERFADVAGVAGVRLRMDVQTGPGCTKFHVDNVRLRLLCAYRGAGTDFGVAARGETPAHVESVPRGAVGLFRGGLWPGQPTGMLHRSPPVTRQPHVRLLLVIDPDEAADTA